MRKLIAGLVLIVSNILLLGCESVEHTPGQTAGISIALPPPVYESETSVEQALLERRSVREYGDEPLTLT